MNIPQAVLAKPAWWFAAACGLLTVLLLFEWLPAAEPAPIVLAPVQQKPASDGTQDAGGDAAGDAGGDRDSATWAETVTARPLFTVGRRPPKRTASGNTVAASGMPRLSGIIIDRGSRRAIFMPDGGKPIVLAEGASLDEGTIRRIVADRVIVSGPKGDMVVYPSFDNNRVPPAPIIPSGPQFNGTPRFQPMFPQPGLAPGAAAQDANANSNDDDNNDDAAAPQPPVNRPVMPIPPPPGGFRNPMFPRGRPE